MNLLNNSAMNSKDGIVSACSLQILGLLQKHLLALKRDTSVLKMDLNKIMDLFEKHVASGQEPLISITASGILSE
jgi:hypothetical protein